MGGWESRWYKMAELDNLSIRPSLGREKKEKMRRRGSGREGLILRLQIGRQSRYLMYGDTFCVAFPVAGPCTALLSRKLDHRLITIFCLCSVLCIYNGCIGLPNLQI